MKRMLIILLLAISLFPVFGGDFHDVSFSIGEQTYKWPERGISVTYGMNVGLTGKLELDLWGISELVPHPFASNMFGAELGIMLLGPRSTATKVMGSGINMMLSVGGFYRTDNNGAGPMISITPLVVGTPISGRRERILKTGIGYDAVNNGLVVTFSLLSLDYYVHGTWRDYSF